MCERCEHEMVTAKLAFMVTSSDYRFAYDFLSSVLSNIRGMKHITPKQSAAIANIERAVSRRKNASAPRGQNYKAH